MKILLYTLLSILLFYSILQTINLQLLKKTLKRYELHNITLEKLYNNISAFKHDFMNIITAIGRIRVCKRLKSDFQTTIQKYLMIAKLPPI